MFVLYICVVCMWVFCRRKAVLCEGRPLSMESYCETVSHLV